MKTNELAYFTESVNALMEGKLILIDKHVASVLKCVATSPSLCHTLAETLKTMSYATEFSRARVTWTRSDGVVEARLKLPSDRNRLFAFVVCLLTEVDSGRRNILEFLKEYYNDATNEASFAKFSKEVLKPFKHAGERILATIDPESLNAANVQQAESFFKAEKIYIETNTLRQILDQMEYIRQLMLKANVSQAEVAEFNAVSEYMVNALYLKNPKILSVSFIAYKNTLLRYPNTIQPLQVIAQQLRGVFR